MLDNVSDLDKLLLTKHKILDGSGEYQQTSSAGEREDIGLIVSLT